MRVLLISPNISRPPVMPIGMRYIAEAAIDAGHQIACLDLCFENPMRTADVLRRRIHDYRPEIIGISLRNLDVEDPNKLDRSNYANYNLANYNLSNYSLATYSIPTDAVPSNLECFDQAIDACRKYSDVPIVLGGPAFTLIPRQFLLRYKETLGVVGPGEQTFLRLLKALEGGHDIGDIPNVVTSESSDDEFARISTAPLPAVPFLVET